jgi:sugar phosphate isomerase/epimerase
MKFGVMQNVLGEGLDTVLATAAQLGFDGVELDWRSPEDVNEGGAFAPSQRAAIRERAQAAGVEIASLCAGWGNRGGLADPDESVQQTALAAIRAGIQLAADLGARVILVPFFGRGEIRGGEAEQRLVQPLCALAPEAERRGVRLGVESTLPAARVRALLERVNSPAVGSYWDMANAMWLGYDPVEEVKTLGDFITQVHGKEFKGAPTPDSSRVYDGLNAAPLGEGMVPVREVLSALRAVGYDGYVVLETGAFGDRLTSAQAALNVLRAAAGKAAMRSEL